MALVAPAIVMEAVYIKILLLRNLKEHVVLFIPLALATGVLYLISVWLVFRPVAPSVPAVRPDGMRRHPGANAPGRRTLLFIFAAGLVFRATLVPLYPSLSDDLFRYRWEGKAQAAGYNPYLVRPVDDEVRHLRDETWEGVNGKNYVSVYGPLTELILRWWYPVASAPGSVYLSVLLMKAPQLAFDLGTALLLVRLLAVLGLPAARVLVYWWSPITVIEFAASGHNDSFAVFFLVLALIGFAAGEKAWSLAALALATLAKLFAAFLWPVIGLRWIEQRRWRDLLWPVLCAVVIYWPYRGGLGNVVPGVSVYAGSWRNNDSLFGIFYAVTGSQMGASAAYGATVAAVAGFVAGRGMAPLRAAFIILGTVLLCASNVFSWYVTWLLPLLALYPNPAWLLFSVLVFLSYHVLIGYGTLGVWQDEPRFLLMEYVPFYAMLVACWIRDQRAQVQSPKSKVQSPENQDSIAGAGF